MNSRSPGLWEIFSQIEKKAEVTNTKIWQGLSMVLPSSTPPAMLQSQFLQVLRMITVLERVRATTLEEIVNRRTKAECSNNFNLLKFP